MDTIQNFIEQIQNNSLLVTLLGGGIIFTLFRYLTDIASFIFKCTIALVSFEIVGRYNVEYDIPITLRQMLFLLDAKSKVLWNRQFELSRLKYDYEDDKRIKPTSHGLSVRTMYGAIVIVDKFYNQESMKLSVVLNIRVFFKSKKRFMERLVADFKTVKITENDNQINVSFVGAFDTEKQKRSIDTIYTPDDTARKMLEDARSFIGNKELYRTCGIPYKRNYLFYGKPGSGKTSCIHAIASELDWDIVSIDMQKTRIEALMRVLSMRSNTIFVFEDVDAMSRNVSSNRENDDKGGRIQIDEIGEMSLGQLLNVADGLMTPNGCICIFTTNHIDKLDPALLRDGRMDVKAEFKYLDWETSARMIHDKLGIDTSGIRLKDEICPATLQESILQVLIGKKTKEDFLDTVKY